MADAALLVAGPSVVVRPHRCTQPLDPWNVDPVLVEHSAEDPESGASDQLSSGPITCRRRRRRTRAVGNRLEHHDVDHARVGIVAVGTEAVGERGQEPGPRHEVREEEVLDAVEQLGVGDVGVVATGALCSEARTRSPSTFRAFEPGSMVTSASLEPSMARTISTSSSWRSRCSLLTPTAVIMRLTCGP